jgi:beta-mannosidase
MNHIKGLETQNLSGRWDITLAGGNSPIQIPNPLPANVPGTIHTDLMTSGLIPNPFLDGNERLLAWIGNCDWTYSRVFSWSATKLANVDLVFGGLDTVAEIYLNDLLLASVKNQHRSYRFPVRDLLKIGENRIEVRFSSPIRYADKMSLELGYRPHVNHHPYNAIRKTAANFGWDWGIDTSTSGIFREVTLESYNSRIVEVRPVVSVADKAGLVSVHVKVCSNESFSLTASIAGLSVGAEDLSERDQVLELRIEDVDLWSPVGKGEPELYELQVLLRDSSGNEQIWSSSVGFRTISVEFPEDDESTGFEFHVNGEPTFIRGANWIPNDAFLHRITRDSLRTRLTQAKKANINLIRVWGGGIYETDDFYELCDELGLMVWQDFLFACAAYSESGLWDEVEAEARENITRIMSHPSIALWNGNNENLWGFQEWNWESRLEGKTWGEGFYFDLLPNLVKELDPLGSYTPGSPFSPNPKFSHNDENHGSVHIWDLWNQKDYPHYRDYSPRFVAEFGWQGPANWATIKESISDDPLTPESPGMIIHQKAMSGNDKLTDGLVKHLKLPNNMPDWHWAMQLNQANAIRFGLEHMRSEFPRCMGAIVWQLNDCWPVTSWAAIDGAGREKPLFHAIQQSYQDILLTIFSIEGGLELTILNNSNQEVSGGAEISRLDFSGNLLESMIFDVFLNPGSKHQILLSSNLESGSASRSELLVAKLLNKRATFFYADYKDSDLKAPQLDCELMAIENGFRLTVTAKNLVRDLVLMIDKVDPLGSVDSGLITLLPNESHEFLITSEAPLELSQLTDFQVLRSANQLVVTNA